MRVFKHNSILTVLYYSGLAYPSPINISYSWNFGFYAFLCLIIQLISGIFLAMHYAPHQVLAFLSVEHIMRDINYGWLLRYLHANGASMFFIAVYIHTFRGLYFSSYVYPRQPLWNVGVAILLLMILTAFLGYVLPWGQMSFWAATVITNLCSAIPKIGGEIVVWLWGGFAVDNATLNRFFSLHYLFPFLIIGLVFIHFIFLHEHLSNNPIGVVFKLDGIYLYPYYIIKDLYGFLIFFIVFSLFLFFAPNYLGHSDNYIPANPMVTPTHIVPEWYFLPFYAILRSIPDKLAGVVVFVCSLLILFIFPFISKPEVRSFSFRPISKIAFWFIVLNCFFLGWIGGKTVEYPLVFLGQLATICYFSYFFIFVPAMNFIEKFFWNNYFYLRRWRRKLRIKNY